MCRYKTSHNSWRQWKTVLQKKGNGWALASTLSDSVQLSAKFLSHDFEPLCNLVQRLKNLFQYVAGQKLDFTANFVVKKSKQITIYGFIFLKYCNCFKKCPKVPTQRRSFTPTSGLAILTGASSTTLDSTDSWNVQNMIATWLQKMMSTCRVRFFLWKNGTMALLAFEPRGNSH